MYRLELEQNLRLMGFPLQQLVQIFVLLLQIRMELRGDPYNQVIDILFAGIHHKLQ
ncbi:hypothetical protein D3C76_1870780 [compost metagenome]